MQQQQQKVEKFRLCRRWKSTILCRSFLVLSRQKIFERWSTRCPPASVTTHRRLLRGALGTRHSRVYLGQYHVWEREVSSWWISNTDAHWGLWCRSMSCWVPPRRTRGRWWRRWWWQRGGGGRCWPGDRWLLQWLTWPPGDLWTKSFVSFGRFIKERELFQISCINLVWTSHCWWIMGIQFETAANNGELFLELIWDASEFSLLTSSCILLLQLFVNCYWTVPSIANNQGFQFKIFFCK